VMQLLQSGHFNRHEVSIFDHIIDSIYNPGDAWMTAADFRSYIDAQHWSNCITLLKSSSASIMAEGL